MEPPAIAGWNLALRFALEVVALVALGVAGWQLAPDGFRWVLAIGVPVVAAVAWTTFNVPGDPSRSGRAPVEVGGRIRLGVELIVLLAGAAAIWLSGRPDLSIGYFILIGIQYATSLDRVRWLIER